MIQKTWLAAGVVAMTLVASAPVLAQQVRFTADADFLSQLSDCVESEVRVFVSGLSNSRAASPASQGKIEASVVQIDLCEDTTLLDARATANLPNGALSFDGREVILNSTVQMVDAVTRNAISVQFDLTWVGGEQIVATTKRDIEAPGRFVRLDRAVMRTLLVADASGSVSSGGQNFVDGPAADAAISSAAR